jgi:hypothetical protein
LSDRSLSRSEAVHVRAHTRGRRRGTVEVAAHDRSAPDRGDADGASPSAEHAYLSPSNIAKAHQKMQDYLTFFLPAGRRPR